MAYHFSTVCTMSMGQENNSNIKVLAIDIAEMSCDSDWS
jgi:hypothetical protein